MRAGCELPCEMPKIAPMPSSRIRSSSSASKPRLLSLATLSARSARTRGVMSLPGVSAGCTLVFISSLGFYITPALLGGSNTMIAVLIEQEASRLLDWPTASALGTVLLVLTCLLYVVYERAVQWAAGSHPA